MVKAALSIIIAYPTAQESEKSTGRGCHLVKDRHAKNCIKRPAPVFRPTTVHHRQGADSAGNSHHLHQLSLHGLSHGRSRGVAMVC